MPWHAENYERFKAKMQAAKAKPENMNENGIITISGSEILDPSFWAHVDISREGFAKNLDISARLARDFTRKFVTNTLPDAMTYIVSLNCSYDKNLREGEKTFPEDLENPVRYFDNQEDIVNLLWRDGLVPEWIDLHVFKADENFTHINLACCGRFTSNKQLIYHMYEYAPFIEKGPALPTGYKEGVKFDLHWRQNKQT
ncbi:MAG: hypothetical protein IPH06_04570 [Alphaproteobacteria bacterium]|nr:hypothetical protein [Alphaproteobacteria bacterium]QQS57302.1 MAG: hypothetical protein IPN28_00330 [Alphaproteobacteria bacterium]